MVVLDLLMAKSHHWRKPQFYPEDTNVSNEVFHTLEAETYSFYRTLYTMPKGPLTDSKAKRTQGA